MSNELQVTHTSGATVYFQVLDSTGSIYNTATPGFEIYNASNVTDYDISATEQGTASQIYLGDMPGVSAGTYLIIARAQTGGSPDEADTIIKTWRIDWDGSALMARGNLVNNAISAAKIATDAITAAKIASDAITAAKLAADCITAAKIATGAIDADSLASDAGTEIATAILDASNGIETSYTLRQALRLMLSALCGKLSGADSTTVNIRDVGDSKNRISATVDSAGNRSAVTLDAS